MSYRAIGSGQEITLGGVLEGYGMDPKPQAMALRSNSLLDHELRGPAV